MNHFPLFWGFYQAAVMFCWKLEGLFKAVWLKRKKGFQCEYAPTELCAGDAEIMVYIWMLV